MTTFASDACVDTDGTLLSAHTSTSGHTWAKTSFSDAGNLVITSNTLFPDTLNAGLVYLISATPPQADYSVQADITFVYPPGLVDCYPSIRLRALSAAKTGYELYAKEDGSALWTWNLAKNLAGVTTTIGSWASGATLGVGQTVTSKLAIVGNTLTATIDGTDRIVVTDSSSPITAAGKAGLSMYATFNRSAGQIMKNFSADYTPGGGGGSPAAGVLAAILDDEDA